MLCANTMPRSNNAALEQRESGFDAVRVHVTVNVDAILVLNGFMLRYHARLCNSARVSAELVSHDYVNVLRDVFLDVLRQSARFHVLRVEESEFAATLPDADNHLLLALRVPDFMLMTALPSAYGRSHRLRRY